MQIQPSLISLHAQQLLDAWSCGGVDRFTDQMNTHRAAGANAIEVDEERLELLESIMQSMLSSRPRREDAGVDPRLDVSLELLEHLGSLH